MGMWIFNDMQVYVTVGMSTYAKSYQILLVFDFLSDTFHEF